MNILHRRRLSRRTVLRGLGVTLALPSLEIMRGAPSLLAADAQENAPPRRAIFVFSPNGMYMPQWTPAADGPLERLSPLLEPIAPHKADIAVVSGLANMDVQRADGGGPHARGTTGFLTCSRARATWGSDVSAGESIDQAIARHWQGQTRLPSLELSVETPTGTGSCDQQFACIYTRTISWRSPTMPIAREISPRAVFEQLFGDPRSDRRAVARQRRSILDFVREEAAALNRELGRHDQAKLDEYFESVREVERRVASYENAPAPPESLPDHDAIPLVPATYGEHAKLMIDLLVAALATDSTRVASLMLGHDLSNRPFPEIGVNDSHHGVSHHGDREARLGQYCDISRYLLSFYGYLLERLKAHREGEGTLLDRSLVVFGCSIGDGNQHRFDNLPILVGGGSASSLKLGEHVRCPAETPLANFYVSLLEQLGVPQNQFGDSTGPLRGLTV